MAQELLVAGGGIGGLAAALAARRAGWEARLFEQADSFSEVGAGIQLGPNATRILHEWHVLEGYLRHRLCAPPQLRVRDALDGRELACMPLGEEIARRYGAPYVTVHRADLQAALLAATRDAGTRLHAGTRVLDALQEDGCVALRTSHAARVEGDALAVADGVWSSLRRAVLDDAPAPASGHLAYRALARQQDLPAAVRSDDVTVWLAPRMHLVTYPVRAGESLNAVAIVEGSLAGDSRDWDQEGSRAPLDAVLVAACSAVRECIAAMGEWRVWVVHDRVPMRSADAMARGRIALLGDAAHPMRPYLAQGAGMALEDARELQRVLAVVDGRVLDVATALRRYALNRWERAARVQERSRRNGAIFHASGPLRVARNVALRTLGAGLLDQPWLYRW